MLLLPKTVGPFTLVRKLGAGGVAESYLGTLSSPDHKGSPRPVLVRRILPYILRDPARLASTEARVRDLMGVKHPFVVQVLDWVEGEGERFIVEEFVDGVDLERVLAWCRGNGRSIPHNVFLNLATQVCNGLEALHGRPGKGTGSDNVLHLGLKPSSILLTAEGKVVIGGCGLSRSPTSLPHGGVAGPVPARMEYLSPEQTHSDQKLMPASDIFSLGAILYELLTLDPLFRSDSNLHTIHKIRRAEVTTQLLRVKEIMPGLDKVLYRALSLNPRHRYQRAFVLREDLRGLMAGYSFNTIVEDTRAFLGPLFSGTDRILAPVSVGAAPDALAGADRFDDGPPTRVDPDPMSTAAHAALALAERVAREREEEEAARAASTFEPLAGSGPPAPDAEDLGARLDRDPSTLPLAAEPEPPTLAGVHDYAEGGERTLGIEPTEGFDLTEGAPPAPAVSEAPAPVEPPPPPDLILDESSGRAIVAPDSTRGFVEASLAAGDERPPTTEELRSAAQAAAEAATDEAPAAPMEMVQGAFESVDPNSTRGFLKGHVPVEYEPPPAAEPPVEQKSETFTRWVPPPRPASPPVEAEPQPTASPTIQPMDPEDRLKAPAPAPTPSTPAPQRVPISAPAPAPRPTRPPPPSQDDDDLEWRRGPRYGLLAVAALVAMMAIVVCAGGVWIGFDAIGNMFERETVARNDAPAAPDVPPPAPEPAVEPEPSPATAAAAVPAEDEDDRTIAAMLEEDQVGDEPEAVTPAPATTRPAPAHRTTSSASRSDWDDEPEPRVAATRSSTASSSTRASGSSASRSSTSSYRYASTSSYDPGDDAIVDASLDQPEDEGEQSWTDLDAYAAKAESGRLTSSDILTLEMVDVTDRSYTRSRALLLMHAKKNGDADAVKRALDDLFRLPENRYNPAFLTDLGGWYVNRRQYAKALDNARLAERYWARLPPELVFVKKAAIYEIQAASYQGLFYESEDDMELLDQAIRHWEKYRTHVESKSRTDLSRKADEQLAKLEDIRVRLQ